jgi:hypothetical protein
MARAYARPVKTARDHKRASSIADKMLQQTGREPAAERRLQALLHEIEKFDNEDEVEDYSDPVEDVEGLPRRRWSDGASDTE